jgi:hypothetical protein
LSCGHALLSLSSLGSGTALKPQLPDIG